MNHSIAERIIDTGGRTSGFDYLRIFLAMSVIGVHSTTLSYGYAYDEKIWSGLAAIFPHSILPVFFALSGFLVAGSLERCPTLVSFYGLRIVRIIPALFVEVMLSALIFGPLLSTMDLSSYFSASEFHLYFLNILGDIHYLLPGVFTHNPTPLRVNGQLWTVPYELECYVALGALVAIGIIKSRRVLVAVVVLGQCLWGWQAYKLGYVDAQHGASGPVLVLSFLCGLLFFLYREKIILSLPLLFLSVAACVGLLLLPHGSYLIAIPATYITVYLGLLTPPKVKYLFAGDYSYGLYLYGYPIQQAFASIGPWTHHWYLNLAFCLPVAFLVAYVSWNYVEKPALALRRYFPAIERKLVVWAYGAWETIDVVGSNGIIDRLFFIALFVSGVGSAALLLDAHDALGIYSAILCFVLKVAQSRYRRFSKRGKYLSEENRHPTAVTE